jgi:hypothetical protein
MRPQRCENLRIFPFSRSCGPAPTCSGGLEEGADVSSLNPRVCFVAEYSLLEGYEDSLPEPIRRRLTPDLIRKARFE